MVNRPKSSALSRRRGFTLVEVMAVVLILAIAGALVMPMFGKTADSELRAAARLVAADLDYAKIGSVTHADDPRLVAIDKDNNTYHIAAQSSPDTPLTNPATQKDYVVAFGSGRASTLQHVTIDHYDFDGDNQLAFGIYGQLDQTRDATITLVPANDR